jgi:hypothetical protein
MEPTTKERRIVEQLTKEEVKELKRLTSPHGHLNLISEKCKLHPNILRVIIKNGYGLDRNVSKIRQHVLCDTLETKLQNITENHNTAA